MCPGSRVAEVEIAALFAGLLQAYDISLTPDSPNPINNTDSSIAKPVPSPIYAATPIH
eukprot:NODE_6786_length_344_cov_4.420339_g6059_i0.p3 GENE.NODE_6786_length_344_cov_4.420339_g6059_i0~~NODE_6786_length_344_cov_4.420339_g6059_i0.p3  ORF type:complete len:58 (+),score=12.22 NODE_6786_length_344_cov_4.420339_g6059_i0:108-281(+)